MPMLILKFWLEGLLVTASLHSAGDNFFSHILRLTETQTKQDDNPSATR